MNRTGIYKITCKISGKFYIGSASGKYGFIKRFNEHKNSLKRNVHSNKKLQNIYNKYGNNTFTYEVLEECEPNTCICKEQEYLDRLKPELNIAKSATAPMKGKTHSKEAKLKMSKNNKRHNKGKKQPDKTRYKNVISNGGSAIKCIETQEVFVSIAEAARKYTLSRQNISSVIHGRLKTTGKLSFIRIKNYISKD